MRISFALALAAAGMSVAPLATAATDPTAPNATYEGASSLSINTPGGTSISGTTASDDGAAQHAGDQQVLGRIVTELANDTGLRGAFISVNVQGGRATLTGTARDQEQAEHARRAVEGIVGAGNVTSAIESSG